MDFDELLTSGRPFFPEKTSKLSTKIALLMRDGEDGKAKAREMLRRLAASDPVASAPSKSGGR